MLLALALALAPLLVTLDVSDEWKAAAADRGWQWVGFDQDACGDAAVKSLEAQIAQRTDVDRNRVYLIGREENAACVFYAVSRAPGLWAGAVAMGGDARRAIDTNRLFTANLSMTPILWGAKPDPMRRRIPGVTEREQVSVKDALDFLAEKQRDPWPLKIDYETGNTNFLRCFWLEVAKVDASRRNDAIPISRIAPGSGASLAPDALKPGDKLLSINGRDPSEFLEETRQEKNVAAMVQRGKDRVRLETRVVMPTRGEALTVRFQAEVEPATNEILLITRGIAGLRLNLPERWTPATVNWNGPSAVKLVIPGCYLLIEAGGDVTASPCQ